MNFKFGTCHNIITWSQATRASAQWRLAHSRVCTTVSISVVAAMFKKQSTVLEAYNVLGLDQVCTQCFLRVLWSQMRRKSGFLARDRQEHIQAGMWLAAVLILILLRKKNLT